MAGSKIKGPLTAEEKMLKNKYKILQKKKEIVAKFLETQAKQGTDEQQREEYFKTRALQQNDDEARQAMLLARKLIKTGKVIIPKTAYEQRRSGFRKPMKRKYSDDDENQKSHQ